MKCELGKGSCIPSSAHSWAISFANCWTGNLFVISTQVLRRHCLEVGICFVPQVLFRVKYYWITLYFKLCLTEHVQNPQIRMNKYRHFIISALFGLRVADESETEIIVVVEEEEVEDAPNGLCVQQCRCRRRRRGTPRALLRRMRVMQFCSGGRSRRHSPLGEQKKQKTTQSRVRHCCQVRFQTVNNRAPVAAGWFLCFLVGAEVLYTLLKKCWMKGAVQASWKEEEKLQ